MTATHHTSGAGTAVSDASPRDTQSDTADQLVERARKLGPVLREHSDEAERQRRLPKPVLEALTAAGFQRLLTPRSLGGLEVDPLTCARIVEELAGFDSAAAWALQSPNVNVWWASRLPEAGVDEFYGSNPDVMMGAAFHPPQQATEVPGGFRVTGRAPLASMIHDSEWVLFSAFIMDGGQPRMTEFGPSMIAVILSAAEVQIIDTWHTLGMRGSDSNDAAFTDVFVPVRRSFPLVPEFEPGRHFQGPLYRFPASAIIALFSAGVLMAAARGAIAEFRDLAQRKVAMGSMKTLRDRGSVQATLAEAEGILRAARALFYDTFSEAWARTSAGQPNTLEHRADLMIAGIHAARSAAQVTDLMHRLAGTTGIYSKSRLDRYFRDAHTLRHHAFVSESKLETVGQIYLGLPPDFPLIAF
jgi:alkylation response protein AidB-like acyl-CoA dehydrogenase